MAGLLSLSEINYRSIHFDLLLELIESGIPCAKTSFRIHQSTNQMNGGNYFSADFWTSVALHSLNLIQFSLLSNLNHIDHECSMQPYCYNIIKQTQIGCNQSLKLKSN